MEKIKSSEPSPQARFAAIADAVAYMQRLVDDAEYDCECAATDAERAHIVARLQAAVQCEADEISGLTSSFVRAGILGKFGE